MTAKPAAISRLDITVPINPTPIMPMEALSYLDWHHVTHPSEPASFETARL